MAQAVDPAIETFARIKVIGIGGAGGAAGGPPARGRLPLSAVRAAADHSHDHAPAGTLAQQAAATRTDREE